MSKRFSGLIVFLFGASILSLELFFIQLIRHFTVEAGVGLSVPYLLFVFFPMNLGFYIPIILIIIGLSIMNKNNTH